MTLDEAIAYAEDVANKQNEIAFELNTTYNAVTEYSKECSKCAEDHRQLAEWLKELKRYREKNFKSYGYAEYDPDYPHK